MSAVDKSWLNCMHLISVLPRYSVLAYNFEGMLSSDLRSDYGKKLISCELLRPFNYANCVKVSIRSRSFPEMRSKRAQISVEKWNKTNKKERRRKNRASTGLITGRLRLLRLQRR